MAERDEAEHWRKEYDKLELLLLELADHFGLGLIYECNKPGVMGWWWFYGEGTPGRISMKGDYIDELPDAVENFFKTVGFKGRNYIPR